MVTPDCLIYPCESCWLRYWRWRERGGRFGWAKECREDLARIELALLNRPEDAREDGMAVRAPFGWVAAADLARNDGRAERLFEPGPTRFTHTTVTYQEGRQRSSRTSSPATF